MEDGYALLARYYDAENTGLVEDLAAYEALVERFGGPVLDVGCGTGRVTFHLARRGVCIVGIDSSAAMLGHARARLERQPRLEGSVKLHHDDVRRLALNERFNLAIFTYNGFMHLTRRQDQVEALTRIRDHLTEQGAVVLDLPNPVEIFSAPDAPGLVLERVFVDQETGGQVMQQSFARLDRAAQLMDVTWVYDRVEPDGSLRRLMVPLTLRYTFAPEMELLLEKVGLKLVDLHGDYAFNPYDQDSPRMLVIAAQAG